MARLHLHTIKTFLIALCLASALGTEAANILRSTVATIEAPEGLSYDAALSAKMEMDVYRNHDSTLIFALGEQEAARGITPLSLAAVIARDYDATLRRVAGTDTYAAFDKARHRIFAVTSGPRSLPVVLIIGSIDYNTAMRYLATLRPL